MLECFEGLADALCKCETSKLSKRMTKIQGGERESRYCDIMGMDLLVKISAVSGWSLRRMVRLFKQCDNGRSFSISFTSNGRCASWTVNVMSSSLRTGQWMARERKTWNVGELAPYATRSRASRWLKQPDRQALCM